MELITPALGLIFWTALIFGGVLFVLAKFAWKPIVSALNEREQFIEDALQKAELAKAELLRITNDNLLLLEEAKIERSKILKEAQEVAASIIAEATSKATQEGFKIIEQAQKEILLEKNAAVAEIRTLIVQTSLEIAEKLIKKNLAQDQTQKDLIATYLNETVLN